MKPTNDRPKLGQTTTDAGLLGRRDAFHVPGVLAAVAKYGLEPGSKVKWVAGSRTMVRAWDEDEEGGEPGHSHLARRGGAALDPARWRSWKASKSATT